MVQITLSAIGVLLKLMHSTVCSLNMKQGHSNGTNISVSNWPIAQGNAKHPVPSKYEIRVLE